MEELGSILRDSASRLFADRFDEQVLRRSRSGELDEDGWSALADAGLPLALVSETAGGFGVDRADALSLVRLSGGMGAPAPLAETMLANFLFAETGLETGIAPASFTALADGSLSRSSDGWRVVGEARGVPWGAQSRVLALVVDRYVVRLDDRPAAELQDDLGLPRATLSLDVTVPDTAVAAAGRFDRDWVRAAGAVLRTIEIAGAIATVLDMTVAYASERVQFGKPIGRQQAVQQQLAVLGTQSAAASAAADLAVAAFDRADGLLSVAAAKSRAGEAAGIAAAIAHQVHGAIGFTREHRLHLFTRALWAWRDEYGSERYWNRLLGDAALRADGGYWPFAAGLAPEAVAIS